ncbi:putative sugar kinase [Halolamina pelagica]|uniref:Putative sugar kinase n=1 Tax=Halolamina pelagica TaxID=699431 RepID=A0A0N8I012_9EURY|nr:putative sugar kinase [Halolamina pelagica]
MSDAGDDVPPADTASTADTDTDPDFVAVGAATVDRFYGVTNLPAPDGGAFAREVSERFGGVGANVATGVARLGRDSALLARLGDDDLGDRVLADLDAGPVSTALLRRGPGTTTHCVILRAPDGERMIVTAGDSTVRLRLDDADRDAIRAADAVFVTAYTPDPVTSEIVEIAAEPNGPALAFDLSGPIEELRDRGTEPATIDRVVEIADLFVTAELAAESYLDCPGHEAADVLRERGCSRGRSRSVPTARRCSTATSGPGSSRSTSPRSTRRGRATRSLRHWPNAGCSAATTPWKPVSSPQPRRR